MSRCSLGGVAGGHAWVLRLDKSERRTERYRCPCGRWGRVVRHLGGSSSIKPYPVHVTFEPLTARERDYALERPPTAGTAEVPPEPEGELDLTMY